MRPEDFDYELPAELIAQEPLPERTASRLLHVTATPGVFAALRFAQLADLLHPGDLLVLNDTRVLPARLFGRKATGGRIEMLLERELSSHRALAQIRASHPPPAGTGLEFDGGAQATVIGRQEEFFILEFTEPVAGVLARHGHVPLPPYIERADTGADRERYQTVFAREPGAVAAPTAGLHFDQALLGKLRERGVRTATLTLHVGAGTFQPVREAQLTSGRLHAERVVVPEELCAAVGETHRHSNRVAAVGTTVVRALETAARSGELRPFQGETDLFIMPGYRFQVVDAMVTNFHLPRSSLLMLVCAFAGTEQVLAAYRHAVAARYRLYSYGDAMFVERNRG